jgi:hypothetical protein
MKLEHRSLTQRLWSFRRRRGKHGSGKRTHGCAATLMLLARLAQRTRTPADDVMASMLEANEDRIVDAVIKLMSMSSAPPTKEQIVEALRSVGINV